MQARGAEHATDPPFHIIRTVPFFNARKQGTMGAPRQLRKRNDNFSKNVTKVSVVGVKLAGIGSQHGDVRRMRSAGFGGRRTNILR